MKKWFIILVNLVLFIAALYIVEPGMNKTAETHEKLYVPWEVRLPHITLTGEMKAVMFFEDLRIDPSVINQKEIMESISPWDRYIKHYSSQHSLDPDLISAVIYAESKGNPFSVSRDGALGLMQIMPSTADFMGFDNMLDPEENIKAGVKYMAWLVKRYEETHVLWAWNAGPGRLKRNFLPNETKKFIVEVISVKTYLKDEKNNTI
ncbi:lytic transglycosylase domain-containing protein [Candidatus Latescibacterota bacterium]